MESNISEQEAVATANLYLNKATDGGGKCPACGEKLKHLKYSQNVVKFGTFRIKLFNKSFIKTFEWDDEASNDEGEYSCPECEAVLFTDEDKAESFLLKLYQNF